MNLLKGTRCYLAGGMENIDGMGWRETAKGRLKGMGVIVFDPYYKPFLSSASEDNNARDIMAKQREEGGWKNWDAISDRMKRVRRDDLRLCDIVDFAIIQVDPKVASWGTAEELFTLNAMKKPIYIWVEGGIKRCPFWLFGTVKVEVIHDTLSSVIDDLQFIDLGFVEPNDRWKILREEYR